MVLKMAVVFCAKNPLFKKVKLESKEETMKTYDRNRNAITIGSRVMVSMNGVTGVIKEIIGEGKSEEQLRRSNCVVIDGVEGMYCPLDLVCLGIH